LKKERYEITGGEQTTERQQWSGLYKQCKKRIPNSMNKKGMDHFRGEMATGRKKGSRLILAGSGNTLRGRRGGKMSRNWKRGKVS